MNPPPMHIMGKKVPVLKILHISDSFDYVYADMTPYILISDTKFFRFVELF